MVEPKAGVKKQGWHQCAGVHLLPDGDPSTLISIIRDPIGYLHHASQTASSTNLVLLRLTTSTAAFAMTGRSNRAWLLSAACIFGFLAPDFGLGELDESGEEGGIRRGWDSRIGGRESSSSDEQRSIGSFFLPVDVFATADNEDAALTNLGVGDETGDKMRNAFDGGRDRGWGTGEDEDATIRLGFR